MDEIKLGCVILAAGLSRRFSGGDKLLFRVEGVPMIDRAVMASQCGCFKRTAAVCSSGEVAARAEALGIETAMNDAPEAGQSVSVAIGTALMRDMDGCAFIVADQPYLTEKTVAGAASAFDGRSIVQTACGDLRGSPVIFPRRFFDELMALTGDTGGREVIRAHSGDVKLFDIGDRRELLDIDVNLEAIDAPLSI